MDKQALLEAAKSLSAGDLNWLAWELMEASGVVPILCIDVHDEQTDRAENGLPSVTDDEIREAIERVAWLDWDSEHRMVRDFLDEFLNEIVGDREAA
jgi:hypothetical protein